VEYRIRLIGLLRHQTKTRQFGGFLFGVKILEEKGRGGERPSPPCILPLPKGGGGLGEKGRGEDLEKILPLEEGEDRGGVSSIKLRSLAP